MELVAFSEAAKKVMFMIPLQGSKKISFKHPVMVRVDNIGAIFTANNITTKSHSKHMAIRYKYVNYVQDGVIKIIFVESAESDSNILTTDVLSFMRSTQRK